MRQPTATLERPDDPDDPVIVRADSAQAAVELVYDRLGADARILSADRFTTGGLFGFFTREMVRLEALPGSDAPETAEELASDGPTGDTPDATRSAPPAVETVDDADEQTTPLSVDMVLSQLVDRIDDTTSVDAVPAVPAAGPASETVRPFSGLLHDQLDGPDDDVVVGHDIVPATTRLRVPAPARAAAGRPAPLWSDIALLALGLPPGLVEAVAAHRPRDDADWTHALARELDHLCGPVPDGPALLAGPRARRLADAADIDVVAVGTLPPAGRSVAVAGQDRDSLRRYVHDVHEGRWFTLAVGGVGWRRLLFDGPDAVAWAGEDALADAVSVAYTFDVPLTVGVTSGPSTRLIDPLAMTLAVLLREQLEVHL